MTTVWPFGDSGMIIHTGFPERHQQVMRDPADPIHRACDLLLGASLAMENERLHSPQVATPWPDFLVAFASQGCGDYFAYDMRQSPPSVIYMDPDATPQENLANPESVRFLSFNDWYTSQIEHHTCQRCGSRDIRFVASEDRVWILRVCANCSFEEPTERIDA